MEIKRFLKQKNDTLAHYLLTHFTTTLAKTVASRNAPNMNHAGCSSGIVSSAQQNIISFAFIVLRLSFQIQLVAVHFRHM